MRCRKHPMDLSSTVGVCASCLRESLFTIMAVQTHRKPDIQQQLPIPFSFPRSVSPYISRRKSDTDTSTWQIHGQQQRFYSTPQVRSTMEITNSTSNKKKKRNGGGRLSSLFFGLFRSKSELNSKPVDSCSASSPSWFSTVVLRKKQIRMFSLDERITVEKQQRRICGDRDRGMSPAMYPDEDDDCGSSGYSSEGWKLTPRRTPATMRRSGVKAMGGVSGLAFCLSPLVRASPNRQWNQKGLPPETVVGSDYRAPSKPYISTTSSFCKNRSRKLTDFGRYKFNPNY